MDGDEADMKALRRQFVAQCREEGMADDEIEARWMALVRRAVSMGPEHPAPDGERDPVNGGSA